MLGFSPEHTTAGAFADFGRTLAPGLLPSTRRTALTSGSPAALPAGGSRG